MAIPQYRNTIEFGNQTKKFVGTDDIDCLYVELSFNNGRFCPNFWCTVEGTNEILVPCPVYQAKAIVSTIRAKHLPVYVDTIDTLLAMA